MQRAVMGLLLAYQIRHDNVMAEQFCGVFHATPPQPQSKASKESQVAAAQQDLTAGIVYESELRIYIWNASKVMRLILYR